MVISSDDEPVASDMMNAVVYMYQVELKWGIWWNEVDDISARMTSGKYSGTAINWLGYSGTIMHACFRKASDSYACFSLLCPRTRLFKTSCG